MSFEDDLAAVQAAPARYVDVDVTVNGNLYTLRFEAMDPFEWSTETDRHPARPGVGVDTIFHYNIRSLAKAVAVKTGSLVDGDGTKPVADWPALFKAIGGNGAQKIADAIWNVNERLPELEVEAAKKARAVSPTA